MSQPSGFDVAALQRLLDGEHHANRDALRARLSQPDFAYRYDLDPHAYRERVLGWLRTLAREGYGATAYPVPFGGGGDPGRFLALFETLGAHDQSLVTKFGVQFGLFGGSIFLLGTERHHARYLRDVGSLALPGCFAMSELGHGSNVREIETEAVFDPAAREFVIHTPSESARKEWIGNAALHGRIATVFAQLVVQGERHGVHAFLVPLRDAQGRVLPGIRIEDDGLKGGLNGVDNGRIWFDHVRIPRENLLNRWADVLPDGTYTSQIASPSRRFFTMLGTLVGGRISVALTSLSAAKAGLAIAVRYGAARRQFGPEEGREIPILDYRTHQRRLFPALATVYATDFALKALVRRYLDPARRGERELEANAAGLKAFTTWHTLEALQAARECCGGQGYLAVNRLTSLRADADITATYEGDNTVLMQLVARGLLTGYRRQFEAIRVGSLLKYATRRASATIARLNPVLPRLTDEDHLRDPAFQLRMFQYREERLLRSAARRLKRSMDEGADAFGAFMECQDHLVTLAGAHVERVILEEFIRAKRHVDRDLRPILTLLRELYALSRLERHEGWYLAHGVFEGNKAKAVRWLVNRCCAELRPYALDLVAAFGIPDAVLGAPIALGVDAAPAPASADAGHRAPAAPRKRPGEPAPSAPAGVAEHA
jgi:acyl-CoA oxidase